MFGTVFDAEFDGLTPTKVHVLAAATDLEEEPRATTDYDKMRLFLQTQNILVGHNIIRFDIPELERLLGVKLPDDVLLIDTLALSWYLYPKRKRHGLEEWGEELGISKPSIDDWFNLSIEEYTNRCVEDVRINRLLWDKEWKYLLALYGTEERVIRFLRYLAFKMDCAREQERSRWKLDVDSCQNSIRKLEALQQEKTDELRRAMPKVPITKLVKRPSKIFKQDGTPSEAGKRWLKLLESRGLPPEYDEGIDIVTGYDEPNPGSTDQLKKWLFDLGWKPRTFKENDKGIEVPQINKLKQDGGGVCESILELADKEPAVHLVDGLGVISHRLGILRGFLSNVSEDGYVKAKIQGLTNTLRFKHAEVVNLPKIDAPYGEDVRGCLIAPEGYELCGSDMSSLEDRTKLHYVSKYDPKFVEEVSEKGYDPHLALAVEAKMMTEDEMKFYKWYQQNH